MSLPKKILSSFLAVLLLVLSLSVGIYASAAIINEDLAYRELAELLSNDFVAKKANYSVDSQKEYTFAGWSEENASFKTIITVNAKDNLNGDIYKAATAFMELVEHEISMDYGEGNYDYLTLKETMLRKIKPRLTNAEFYDDYNIEDIVNFFLGTAPSINSGNFYHEFKFVSIVDTETAFLQVPSAFALMGQDMYRYTVDATYTFKREWDALTGTRPLYSFDDFAYTPITPVLDNTDIMRITNAYSDIQNLDINTWNAANFAGLTDAQLAAWRTGPVTNSAGVYLYGGPTFMRIMNNIAGYSSELMFHFFGDKIGDLMHVHGNTQPLNVAPKRDNVRTKADGVTPTPYEATPARMNNIVDNIDSIFTSTQLQSIIPLLQGLILPESEATGLRTIEGLLQELIKSFLYNDGIVNMLFEMVYPMIYEALSTLAPSGIGVVDNILGDIIDSVIDDHGVMLLPRKFANNIMYAQTDSGGVRFSVKYSNAYNELYSAGESSSSWANVNWENVAWGINGDSAKFVEVLSLVLSGLGNALNVLMFGSHGNAPSINAVGGMVRLYGARTYENLIVPLFECLGITPNTPASLRNQSAITIATGIIQPLVNWVEGTLLPNPVGTLLEALPNLAYYFDYSDYSPSKLLDAGSGNFSLVINISFFIITDWGTLYSLKVGELLGDTANMLSSLNGLIQEIAKFDVELEDGSTAEIALPYLMTRKLVDTGTVDNKDNSQSGTLPGGAKHVNVSNSGQVLLYLLRFLFSSLMQRTYNTDTQSFAPASLIQAFGLDLDSEITAGVTIGSIVTNLVYNYDEAICALVELFSPNENGNARTGVPYTYDMNYVDYHNDVLLGRGSNKNFGPAVRYSQYWKKADAVDVVLNLDGLVDNVLSMLKLEDVESLNAVISGLISDNVYSNELLSQLGHLIYVELLGKLDELGGDGEEGGIGAILGQIDLFALIDDLFGAKFDSEPIGSALGILLFGEDSHSTGAPKYDTDVTRMMRLPDASWSETIFYESDGTARDWGFARKEDGSRVNTVLDESGISDGDLFTYSISALLSPIAFLFQYLLADSDFTLLNTLFFPSYAGYQYSWISLLEALSVPASYIDTYADFHDAANDTYTGDVSTFISIIRPFTGLIDKVIESPISTLLTMIPNLMFTLSIGGLNDILNNLLHPLYVLLDMIRPIFDVNSILEPLLAGLDLGGLPLTLSLPLNIDINSLINGLLDGVLGDALTFEISGVDFTLHLPYLDFATLSSGTVKAHTSKTGEQMVLLDSGRGADFITVVLRYIMDVLFLPANANEINRLISELRNLGTDDRKTLTEIFDFLSTVAVDYDLPDRAMQMLYMFISVVIPVADELGSRFKVVNFSIIDLLNSVGDNAKFMSYLDQLMKARESNQMLTGFARIFEMLREFFEKIAEFFRSIFGG